MEAPMLFQLVPVASRLALAVGIISIPIFCIYQIYFHPFAKYPGPLLAKFTLLRDTYHVWKGDIHLDMYRLHQKYGPIVRYGPSVLLFDSATAMKDILGQGKNFGKGGSYKSLNTGAQNVLTMVDKKLHGKRRRLLGHCFTDKALKEFEPKSLSRIKKFCNIICPIQGQNIESNGWGPTMDTAYLFSYLVLDTLNDFVFGLDRRLLEVHDKRSIVDDLERLVCRSAVLLHYPELIVGRIDKALFPAASKTTRKVAIYLKGLMQEHSSRAGRGESKQGAYGYLQTTKDPETGELLSQSEAKAEASILTLAGGDATSTGLCATMFYLINNPHAYSKLATEVRDAFTFADEIQTGEKLRSCRYLRACIDEALRLSPPVGQSLFREAGTGGAFVDGHYIPRGSLAGTGIYSLHHNPKYFPRPFSFLPERWLADGSGMDGDMAPEQLNLAKSAYIPFSTGSRSCIAKALAYNMMLVTIATLIWKFDFKLADGPEGELGSGNPFSELGRTNPGEFQLYSHITSFKRGPVVRFRPRKVPSIEGDI